MKNLLNHYKLLGQVQQTADVIFIRQKLACAIIKFQRLETIEKSILQIVDEYMLLADEFCVEVASLEKVIRSHKTINS